MASANISLKRKASSSFVPDSFTSFLMGAMHDNFDHLKALIKQDCAFVAAKADSGRFTKQLIEELFRYLYLLADSSSDGVICSSPSYFVDQAFHCLMLDPVLYFNICDEVLNLLGKEIDTVKMRVLPHDALGGKGDDEGPRRARYTNTLTQYKATFGEDPPLAIWSYNPVAVRTELVAQEAHSASLHRPRYKSVSSIAVARSGMDSPSVEILTIKVKEQSSEERNYKLKKGTKMIKLMQSFAEQKGKKMSDFRFLVDGCGYGFVIVNEEDTPLSLDLEDGDEIISIMEQNGG